MNSVTEAEIVGWQFAALIFQQPTSLLQASCHVIQLLARTILTPHSSKQTIHQPQNVPTVYYI